jgi:hypothetical protein
MPTGAASRRDWLNLLEVSGPFLSPPVLDRVFPQGLDALDTDHAAKLRLAREDWAENQLGQSPDPAVHNRWIRLVLAETLGYTPELLAEGDSIPSNLVLDVHEHQTTLRPDFVLIEPSRDGQQPRPRLLIAAYPLHQDLDGIIEGSRWAAPPSFRMTEVCRETGVRLGLITNGERWMLVDSPRGETSAYISWYASLWPQEPETLRAFQSLLHARRFFGVDETDTLEALLVESASYQAELTDQLGAQVRRAVEVLIQALDRADADTGRKLLHDVGESELYEAAITVMMRLVFLFFAEENGLLLLGDELYDLYYSASMLRGQLREEADKVGVEVLERRHDAWSRILATFRGIFAGVNHEALHLPAYGGSLFDPDRFPFLEGRQRGTRWRDTEATPLRVDNRTVLHLLDSLQLLQSRERGRPAEARKLSFRALDIEQIGHVYESLLDHTAVRATGPQLGLVGPRGAEPEVALDELAAHRAHDEEALINFLAEKTKKGKPAIARALSSQPDQQRVERIRVACADDKELVARVLPYHGLLREDPWGDPVVVQTGSIYVTAGQERRGAGTYYTPRVLTEEIVGYALEPLAYRGPAEGRPRGDWTLKQPRELLDLKICDIAMGSGAFLVQTCRWLGERLVEAWERAGADQMLITPEGEPATDAVFDTVVPPEPEQRLALARRLVGDRCLYGVDINPLAVEMSKLSLWLVTLAKGRPFSFLDHALRCGDSLLGVYDLEQIRHFHPHPDRGATLHATLVDPRPHIEKAERRALELRRELEAFPVLDVKDAERKSELNREAERALQLVHLLADLVVGAAVLSAERGGRALDATLQALGDPLEPLFEKTDMRIEEMLKRRAKEMLDIGKAPSKPSRRPFHWPVEFPEVFMGGRGGFDAILGNPPFLGNKYWKQHLGEGMQSIARLVLDGEEPGKTDLAVLFFRRAYQLLATGGVFGLIGTKSVSEGESARLCFHPITRSGRVYRAERRRRWPGTSSVVMVSIVWAVKGPTTLAAVLDGRPVVNIGAELREEALGAGREVKVLSHGIWGFKGVDNTQGLALVLQEGSRWLDLLRAEPSPFLRAYITGDDIASHALLHVQSWVVATENLGLEEIAKRSPLTVRFLLEVVQPTRTATLLKGYEGLAERWWQFWRTRADVYRRLRMSPDCVVLPIVAKYIIPMQAPTGWVYTNKVLVLEKRPPGLQTLLLSSFGEYWIRARSGSLGEGLSINYGEAIRTLALPSYEVGAQWADEWQQVAVSICRQRRYGFTALLNEIHDSSVNRPDVEQLRRLHVAIDTAVATAYGCADLVLDHDFHETSQGIRYTIAPSTGAKVLEHLMELNHERANQEVGTARATG